MAAPATGIVDRARRFLFRDLWRMDLQGGSLATAPVRFLQFAYMVVEGFIRDELLLRASALTYIAVLSVVPTLAVVISVLKAVGVSENLAIVAVDYFAAGSPDAKAYILPMVERLEPGGFGTLGAAILFVTSVLGLRHGESALNEIWGVVRGRSWSRRFTDYLTVMIIAPLCLGVALSLGTTLQSEPAVAWLLQYPLFELLYEIGLQQAPLFLLMVAFGFIYWFLPNTDVRATSAALGGLVAALLFGLAQYLYLELSLGAARYNAFFGSFAVLALLFVWIYFSMAIFLMGAEISFAHQNLARYRREIQAEPIGSAEREVLGLCIALEVARSFRDREGPCSADALADRLNVSVRAMRDLLQVLEAEAIVSLSVHDDREEAYQLGRPATDIALRDVLTAVRGLPLLPGRSEEVADTSEVVGRVIGDLALAAEPITGQQTLADLLGRLPARRPPPQAGA
jgi:membrane protein